MSPGGSVRARRVAVADKIDTLGAPDYASAFEITIAGADVRSPEQSGRPSHRFITEQSLTFSDAPRRTHFISAGV